MLLVPHRHHQRAPRAARVSRRRASARRHRDHSDDVVRRRRRRARRSRPRMALPAYVMAPLNAAEFSAEEGVREGQQHGSEANVGRVAVTGRLEYVGRRGLTVGAGFWSGRSGFEFRPTLRRAGDGRRSRCPLHARPARAARPVRAGVDRQRRLVERHDGASNRRQSEHRANASWRLRRGQLPGHFRRAHGRRRAVHALRERRHAAPDAGRVTCRSRRSIATSG